MAKFVAGRGRGRTNKIDARIVGLDRLQTEFKQMKSGSDTVMTREIHRTAERIAERANREVPVDTGRLIRSISVKKWTRAASVLVNAPYALYVEKGTKNMKAQPYIFKHVKPAIDKMAENIKRLI